MFILRRPESSTEKGALQYETKWVRPAGIVLSERSRTREHTLLVQVPRGTVGRDSALLTMAKKEKQPRCPISR